MTSITLPPPAINATLNTSLLLSKNLRVDRERRVIRGVSLIQLGDVNDDRPWNADAVTLQQTIKLGKSNPKGLKARWTHPNMSSDGLGKFVGRHRRFRLSEDKTEVLTDVHLAAVAFKSNAPGMTVSMGEYLLDMAENDPDAIGLSIHPKQDTEAMGALEQDGQRTPMRFKKLVAGDFVDEPAATRGGLFGANSLSIATAPQFLTEALDKLFPEAAEGVIRQRSLGFFDTYLANRFGNTLTKEANNMSNVTKDELAEAIAKNNESLLSSFKELLPKAPEPAPPTDPSLSDGPTAEAIQEQAKELTALAQVCGLSNSDELLAEWMGKLSTGFTVTDAKAQIGDMAIKNNTLTDGDPNPSEGADIDQKLSAAYDENAKLHKGLGLSKEDWVKHAKKQLERDAKAAA